MLRPLLSNPKALGLFRPSTIRSLASEVPGSSQYAPRRERWITPTMLLVGFIPILSFGLGTWQLQRLQWKTNLIDELQEKLQLDPLSLPPQINITALPDFVYRKVLLKGRWDHEHTMFLGPRVRDGSIGFHLITPLLRENGSTVLVNRGFILKDLIDTDAHKNVEGLVEVLGLLRTGHARNPFTPDNHPEQGIWHWIDLPTMAESAGGTKANVQPVFVEEVFEGNTADAAMKLNRGIPIGRPLTVDLRNAHLSYMITWYSLSALTAGMFIRFLLKRRFSRPLPRGT